MEQVIGYYYKGLDKETLSGYDVKPNELIGTTIESRFAVFVDKTTMKDTNPDDIIQQMISDNKGIVVEYNEKTHVAKVEFKHPIPKDIFSKYYKDEKPYFK